MSPLLNMLSNKKIILSKISLFFAPFLISAQTLQENIQHNLNAYFSKDHAVKNYVAITKDSFLLYAGPLARTKKEKPEFALSWKQVKILSAFINKLSTKELEDLLVMKKDSLDFYMAKYSTDTVLLQAASPSSLKGLKVAIDPGHIGGTYSMGKSESRCMTLYCDSINKADSIRLIEGNLTFFTALILKKKLEDNGAEVMLTRKDTGISALDITYYKWKELIKNPLYIDSLVDANLLPPKDVRLLGLKLQDKVLFEKVFGSVDMAERAKKMNAFHPDVSVVIHYNVNEQNAGWAHPTGKDYVMTFVGGCIVSKDLETKAGRLNFLRLLISPDIENSINFSSKVIHHLSNDLGIPIARKEDATYLAHNCISTKANGVYSRDLALTRIIRGTLVYGEALYQDNEKECRLLSTNDDSLQGCSFSKRIELVADSYYKGILDYLAGQQKK
jgi:N-acetylmuramoyl-L-alanine amidase